jgi:HD-like signal output (HDOD) protein
MQHDVEALHREAEQIVKNIRIPPCPAVLTKLLHEMREDEPDFAKIGHFLSGDVSLAAMMLKTVNSPFYGLHTKARSVPKALALLGLQNVAQLVTGLLLRQAFPVGDNEAMEEFWDASSNIALITAYLARKVHGVNRDDAYTFALFRDCGIPAMMSGFRDYQTVLADARIKDAKCITDVENDRYGTNHALTGYHLAKSWLLPEATCEAVLGHHDYASLKAAPAGALTPCAKLIALALTAERLFVKQSLGSESPEWRMHGDFVLEQLDITQSEFDASAQEIESMSPGQ